MMAEAKWQFAFWLVPHVRRVWHFGQSAMPLAIEFYIIFLSLPQPVQFVMSFRPLSPCPLHAHAGSRGLNSAKTGKRLSGGRRRRQGGAVFLSQTDMAIKPRVLTLSAFA